MARESEWLEKGERLDRGAPRLKQRDRQLVGAVAIARYLASSQLQRLFFRGRSRAYLRRLLALAGLTQRNGFVPPYLRRVPFRTTKGTLDVAWALTEPGYALATEILGTPLRPPAKDVGAAYLEHDIALSELFVQLALPHLGAGVSVGQLPFRWHATETVRLPWTEYNLQADATRQRLIVPDAVLELPSQRRRVFVECEMGTHSIVAASDEKSGATLAKAERYEAFFTRHAGDAKATTFYAAAYPDGMGPELLFLVQTTSRRDSVNQVLDRWEQKRVGSPFRARACTLVEAVRAFGGVMPPAPAAAVSVTAPRRSVSDDEVRALRAFYQLALTSLAPGGLTPELKQAAAEVRPVLIRLAESHRSAP